MPNYLRNFLVFTLFLSVFNQKSIASHCLGAELFYTWNGGTKYTVTVYAYRDCNGLPLAGGSIDAVDQYKDVAVGGTKCCGKDITPACASSCTRCTDLSCNFGFGIQKWTITGDVDVSQFKDCNIQFRYYGDGTAATTTNVSTYQANIYVEAYLNRCNADHSSPAFEFNPRTTLCVKQPVDEYVTAKPGTNNDSIVYKLAEPQIKSGSAISYNTGFSYLSPLSYNGSPGYGKDKPAGFHYDGKTGEFFFVPTKVESSFMQFEADQYLKDSSGNYYHAGETVRLIAMNIIDCNANHLPTVSHADISSSDTFITCSNVPIKFTISTSDSDSNSSTTLSIQDGTGGKTSLSSSNYQSATYIWIPKAKDVRKVPYTVTFTAKDDACTLPGLSQRRIYIIVKDSLPVTAIKLTDSGCGRYHMGLTTIPDKNYNLAYQWYFDTTFISKSSDFSYKNTQAGKHILGLVITNKNTGCAETITDTIYYDTAYHKLPLKTSICKGDAVQLLAANGKNIHWWPQKGLSDSTINNPIARPDTTTLYTISGTDANGCAYNDREKVLVNDFKIIKSSVKAICNGTSIKLFINHIPGATNTWDYSPSLNTLTGDTVIAMPHKSSWYYVSANLNGCIKKDSFYVPVNETRISLGPDITVCAHDTVKLTAYGGTAYRWFYEGHTNIVLSTDSVYTISNNINTIKNGVPFLVLVNDRKTGCIDSGEIKVFAVDVSPQYQLKSGDICKGEVLNYVASGGTSYLWDIPGIGTSSQSELYFQPKKTVNITLKVGKPGCTRTVIIPVYVPPAGHSYSSLSICSGDSVRLQGYGGSNYLWYPASSTSNPNAGSPYAFPKSTTLYTVYIKDSAVGCYRLDSQMVNVYQDCIWPGDANKDKTADYLDVLNIGVGYGTKGPARDAGTTKWKRYPATNWKDTMTNGINYKHLDCNGDGVIDAKDTMIINANYGLKHTKWTAGTGNPNNPPLYFKFVKDTFYAGDTAMAYLYAGSSSKPLKGTYGIGYQATWSGTPIMANSGNLAPFCDYFCSGNELNYLRTDYINNHIDAVTVETNSMNTSNSMGKIAYLRFNTLDSLAHNYPANGEKVFARLLSAIVIDSAGKEINVYGLDDSAVVLKAHHKKSGINNQSTIPGLKIYPNPANNNVMVVSDQVQIKGISIYNTLGQNEMEIIDFKNGNAINVSKLVPGLYIMEIKTERGTALEKLVIEK